MQIISHCYGNSRAMWYHSRGDIPAFAIANAGTGFSDPRGMQGWVNVVGLITYRGGIPVQRRSPIPVLTRLNVEQLRSFDERRYHYARPPTVTVSVVRVSKKRW